MRKKQLERLSSEILKAQALCRGPLKIAVDGIDAAGKTTLANELAKLLAQRQTEVLRVSIDDFHRPRAQRYRQGPDSAVGFYRDSFDYPLFRRCIFEPLQTQPPYRLQSKAFDHVQDAPVCEIKQLSEQGILLVDGIFLQCRELQSFWDLCIFVQLSFETALKRNLKRSQPGDFQYWTQTRQQDFVQAQTQRYRQRYQAGQELYIAEIAPHQRAQILWDNEEIERPQLVLQNAESD